MYVAGRIVDGRYLRLHSDSKLHSATDVDMAPCSLSHSDGRFRGRRGDNRSQQRAYTVEKVVVVSCPGAQLRRSDRLLTPEWSLEWGLGGHELGHFAQVLRDCCQVERITGAICSPQTQTIELQDALEGSKQRLNLLPRPSLRQHRHLLRSYRAPCREHLHKWNAESCGRVLSGVQEKDAFAPCKSGVPRPSRDW